MAAGVAVIATRVGGMGEAVESGATGILVEPQVPKALAEALAGLARSPEQRRVLGRAAQAMVRERFSVQNAVKAYSELYEKALD